MEGSGIASGRSMEWFQFVQGIDLGESGVGRWMGWDHETSAPGMISGDGKVSWLGGSIGVGVLIDNFP